MRWMNSPKVQHALAAMSEALKKVDKEEDYLIRQREDVLRAEIEVQKSENRIADLREKAKEARVTLEEHGFLVNESATVGL